MGQEFADDDNDPKSVSSLMLRLIVNIHPVACDLVFEEISPFDAERLLAMIEESIDGGKEFEEKKLLNLTCPQ